MYRETDGNIKNSVDWWIILIYLVLVIAGWFSIYAASFNYEHATSMFDLSTRAGSQLIWICSSCVLGFILLKLDSNMYDIFAYFIYAFFILLLLVTIFVAPDIKGSRSWLVITSTVRLQPAEFAKFAVALALAHFMNSYGFKLLSAKNILTIICLIAVPMAMILLQKETGSALVYTAFLLVLYREGLPGIVLLSGLCAIVLFVVGLKYSDINLGLISLGEFVSILLIIIVCAGFVFNYGKNPKASRYIILFLVGIFGVAALVFYRGYEVNWGLTAIICMGALMAFLCYLAWKHWKRIYLFIAFFAIAGMGFITSVNYVFEDVLQPHQQMRIKVALGMEEDLMGAGYNVNQSKIAIGSGGFTGKGFLNGTQTKLKYVPEQDTDFIFCTIGEEMGFVGSTIVLLLFLALILRLIFLAERQENSFGRVYGYSVAAIFLFHLTVNIGMVIGLMPVIGIPLPFFSYGGSSLWGFTILLFIFLRIDMSRKTR
ncbi:rod shape-determining protein RodA [Dysgonomonas sp. 216]|uniref:rod shape-determining protein RodA n=1 Tax=Dysgonomonas sp. 216 TaxID=2302934 RepID=UPI0013CF5EBC|nr:rod shape-determining protein RodA [Dysgonomonas sp. 216]NDW18072.1 rod shape-determining protein RodA [Dysgonomonas sp. 216]